MTEARFAAAEPELPKLAARVLLVEDEPVNVEVARAVLDPFELNVSVAISGSEAVAAGLAERFDLILMDLQLPDFDGFEAARRIRAGEAPGRRTPIVAMSGTVGPEIPARCIDAGMDGFAGKPLTSELFARLASRWLAGRVQAGRRAPEILSPERLAGLFRQSAARLVAKLQCSHAAGDRDAVMSAAHSLKSISARVPADRLNTSCAQLEAAASNRQATDLEPAVARVLAAYAALDPLLRGDSAEALREEHVLAPAAQSAQRVLLVDDDENERFLVRRMLEQAGYRVDECDCGQAAIACCRNQRPDVVFLDGLMPGMDGIVTCRALRADFPSEDLPILMFTGLTDPAWRARALQAGANGFVEKAVGVGQLADNLRGALIACGLAGPG